MAIITEKPDIANLAWEFDARTLQFADGVTVPQWEDQSGNGKDATAGNSPAYDLTGFRAGTASVRLIRSDNDHFTFDGSALISTNLTLFFVTEATAIGTTSHIMTGGSTTSTNLGMIQTFVDNNGAIGFLFFDTGSGINDVKTANSLVATGEKVIITMRHSSTDGKLIRLNGEQVKEVTGATDHLASWADPYIGRVQAASDSGEGRYVWLAAYTQAVTTKEMEDMECYLSGLFGIYVKSCLPPDPFIANFEVVTTVTDELELAQSMDADLQLETVITFELELPQSVDMNLELEGTITGEVDA